jgi:hypothetical protein
MTRASKQQSSDVRRLVVIACAIALVAAVQRVPTATATPWHSGKILGGVLTTAPTMECALVADCVAWLASGCDPELVGIDPAWQTSIEEVSDVAGTTLSFAYGPSAPEGFVGGGVVVQFWTRTCTEAQSSRWRAYRVPHTFLRWAYLDVPANARWMTVTGSENVNIEWWLR